jgi:molecular chaperone DnaJ
MAKSLYEVLGITNEEKRLTGDAFTKIVKDRYREKAKEHHPDRYQDVKEKEKHEAIFKECAEAKEVLSDSNKRQMYDLTGSTSGYQYQRGSHDPDLDDILREFMGNSFSSFFGGGQRHQQREKSYKGRDIRINVAIDIQDAINGCKKKYKFNRQVKCPDCDGTTQTICPHCNGTGMVQQVQQSGFSTFIKSHSCEYCGGTGHITEKSNCKTCYGNGTIEKDEIVEIDIPSGVTIGNYIVKNGFGNEIPKNLNGVSGDLIIVIENIKSNEYKIEGYDLIITKEISILDILTGTKISIKTPKNKTLVLSVPANTEDGKTFPLKNEGLPVGNSGKYGELYVIVKHKFPKKLDKRVEKLLDELKKMVDF